MDEVDRSLREGIWKDGYVGVITADGIDGSDWFMVAPGHKQRNTFSAIDGDDDDIDNNNNNNNSNLTIIELAMYLRIYVSRVLDRQLLNG